MQNSKSTESEDLRIYQIIDANLDRAREGLRVLVIFFQRKIMLLLQLQIQAFRFMHGKV